MMGRILRHGFFYIKEVAPVSQRLDEEKDRIKQQRDRREKDFLFRRKGWAAGRDSEVWQHQTEHSQGHDYIEVGIHALDVVMLLAISQPAKHQRQTYKAAECDHDHGKNCVSPERWIVFAM